ncbi:DUF418 domain-containing protein (plasmid) [Bacillus sp. JAS24-2]|nr:DUF418 domain-containing protein [Bacillus sp. JAS24-2]
MDILYIRFIQILTLGVSVIFSLPNVNYYFNKDIYYSIHIQLWILYGGKTLAIFYTYSLLLQCEKEKWIRWFKSLRTVGDVT